MITIREMRIEDLPEVAEIEKATFSEPWSCESFASSLALPDSLYLTAQEDGTVVGYCGLICFLPEAEIVNMAVKESERGRGIGFSLMDELMDRGHAKGIEHFTLEVRVSNRAAIHLYKRFDFYPVGIRPGFYAKPREDALIMWSDGPLSFT